MIIGETLINKTNNTINTHSILYPPSFPIEKNNSINLYKLYNKILDIDNDELNIISSNNQKQTIKINKNNKPMIVFITKDNKLQLLPTITNNLIDVIKNKTDGLILTNNSTPEEFSKLTNQQYLDIYPLSQDTTYPTIINIIQKTSTKINNNIQIEISILDGNQFQFYQDIDYLIDITSTFYLTKKINNIYLFTINKVYTTDGVYPIYIRVLDQLNNKMEQIFSLIIDRQPPQINIITSITSISNITQPEMVFLSNDDGILTSSLDFPDVYQTIQTGENKIIFNPLIDNQYNNETITITDIIGNKTTIPIPNFIIDTIAPIIISKKQITPINYGLVQIEIKINNGIGIDLYSDASLSIDSKITHLFTTTKINDDIFLFTKKEIYLTGKYKIHIKSFDQPGNTSIDLLEINIDITPSLNYLITQYRYTGIRRDIVQIKNQLNWMCYLLIKNKYNITN